MTVASEKGAVPPAVVVMAKPAVPGQVKTRLVDPLTPAQAAEVHAAMLEAVCARLARHFASARLFVAVAGGAKAYPSIASLLGPPWVQMDQGRGNLGQRMAYVWRQVGGGPIAFFGIDSPDVPAQALDAIWPTLAQAEAALGPVDDGGYWTLAACRYRPELLAGIDWGTGDVLRQTHAAARRADIRLTELPSWFDVDEADDLTALVRRIDASPDPVMIRLKERLASLLEHRSP